jgi:hypothetical protein
MQNKNDLSPDSGQLTRSGKPRFTYPKISRGNRHPVALLKQVLAEVQSRPEKLDGEIAKQFSVRPGLPCGLRLLLTRRPELLDRVLSSELSLGKACELMRQRPVTSVATPTSNSELPTEWIEPKLRADLLAWCALTRELLDSIENVLTGQK